MTRICTVVAAPSAEAMASRAGAAMSAGADMVELRLDHLLPRGEHLTSAEVEAAVAVVKAAGVDVRDLGVLALRAPRDGGAFKGDEERRQQLLHAVAGAGAAWVDLEAWLPRELVWGLSAKARAAGSMVLLSRHLGEGEGATAALDAARVGANDSRADAVKLVLDVDDRIALDGWLGLSRSLSDEGVPHVLLPSGRLGRLGRLLAPLTETEWVYAEPAAGTVGGALGPLGLPLATDLADAWRQSGMRPSLDVGVVTPPPITPADHGRGWTLLAILGDPVGHTMSPTIHHAALEATRMRGVYVPVRTPPGSVERSLEELEAAGAAGCNVTVPLKVEAVEAVDELGDAARLSGAVNTVRFDSGDRVGENTDVHGVRRAAEELMGARGTGRTALVLGTGGAARGAVVGLAGWGAGVLVTGRDAGRLARLAGDVGSTVEAVAPEGLGRLAGGVDLLVQCTSQGMHGNPPSGTLAPLLVMKVVRPAAVLDLVYVPGGTDVVRVARAAGLPASGGERVLLHQAAAAFGLWTGREPPLEAMATALEAAQGIVLPG